MRILYHHRTLGDGAEGVHIREMIRAFRALGHEVLVSALVGEPTPEAAQGSHGQRRWSALRRYVPDAMYELAEVAYNPVGSGRLRSAIARFRPDFVYDRYNSYSACAVDAARRAGIPSVLEVNAPVVHERTAWENLPMRLPGLALRYERHILSRASHVLTVSTPLKKFIVDTHDLDAGKVTVLANGVDPQRFNPQVDGNGVRAGLGLDGKRVIGFSGNVRPWHGLHLVVEALARILPSDPRAHLLIVGGGPSGEALRQQAEALGIARDVTFVERVRHDEVPNFLAAMDIAVSARATFYASPLKIVEYLAMAKPVVAPAMENIEDLVEHERTALLFQAEDLGSLAGALARLVSDEDLCSTLGRQGRERVETRLNWEENARRTISIANELNECARRT